MSGILNLLAGGGGARLLGSFTVTIGGADPYGYSTSEIGAFGSISASGAFTDAGGTPRNITGVWDGAAVAFVFAVDGISVPDTDATFKYLVVNGTLLYRLTRDSYSSDLGASNDSAWTWNNGATNIVGTSGDIAVDVWG